LAEADKKLKDEITEKEKLKELLNAKHEEVQYKLCQESADISTKDLELNNLKLEKTELNEKIELLQKSIENLKKELGESEAAKTNALFQCKQLQEKREIGIKEIQRLNSVIENIKIPHLVNSHSPQQFGTSSPVFSGKEDPTPKSLASLDGQDQDFMKNSKQSVSSSAQKTTSAQASSTNAVQQIAKTVDYLNQTKKFMEGLYKDLIEIITSEEFEVLHAKEKEKENVNGQNNIKTSAKDAIIVHDSIPQKFVKLEKKVNDTISNLQEYIWYLEEKLMKC